MAEQRSLEANPQLPKPSAELSTHRPVSRPLHTAHSLPMTSRRCVCTSRISCQSIHDLPQESSQQSRIPRHCPLFKQNLICCKRAIHSQLRSVQKNMVAPPPDVAACLRPSPLQADAVNRPLAMFCLLQSTESRRIRFSGLQMALMLT
jgi:hypothetical protein